MKIHGLHELDDSLITKGKSTNEIIVLLEEARENKKLNEKIATLEAQLNKVNEATTLV